MLISFDKKFLFIHIPKNAGTSITNVLTPFAFDPGSKKVNNILNFPFDYTQRKLKFHIKKRILLIKSPVGIKLGISNSGSLKHAKAVDLKKILGKNLFDNLFKFAFVRNPWAKEVSNYEYIKRRKDHPLNPLIHFHSLSLEQFLEWKISKNYKSPQLNFIADYNDNLLVDFIGKVEDIDRDIKKISKQINIDSEKVPKLNSRKQPYNYQEFYNSHSKKLVEILHEKELKLFDYSF
ncbi:MAG: sulfotransferase family protein [Okeania sp. SIO3C4]|nr:sulfotransferase family protein [Okeania sp. SIO3C4]